VSAVSGEGLDELLRRPLGRRMFGHIEMEDLPSLVRQHDQHEEHPEADRRTVKKSSATISVRWFFRKTCQEARAIGARTRDTSRRGFRHRNHLLRMEPSSLVRRAYSVTMRSPPAPVGILVQHLVPPKVPLDHLARSHSSYVRSLSESAQLLFPSASSTCGPSLSLSSIIRLGPTENPGVGSSILPLPTASSRTCAALVAALSFSVPITVPDEGPALPQGEGGHALEGGQCPVDGPVTGPVLPSPVKVRSICGVEIFTTFQPAKHALRWFTLCSARSRISCR